MSLRIFGTILVTIICTYPATGWSDPADCEPVKNHSEFGDFQITPHEKGLVLLLFHNVVLEEGKMPYGNYFLEAWGSIGEYRLDVDSYFPNNEGQGEGSYLFLTPREINDDGEWWTGWTLRIEHYTDGVPGGGRIILSEDFLCIDE